MDQQNTSFYKIIIAIVILAVIGLIAVRHSKSNAPGELDSFAQCIKDSGTIFYGAFWCPHCQNQKKMFGSSERLLPYIECSTADGKSQLAVCTQAGVTGYPTWVFPDGTQQSGEVSLETLAEKTQCTLPAGVVGEETASTGGSSSASEEKSGEFSSSTASTTETYTATTSATTSAPE